MIELATIGTLFGIVSSVITGTKGLIDMFSRKKHATTTKAEELRDVNEGIRDLQQLAEGLEMFVRIAEKSDSNTDETVRYYINKAREIAREVNRIVALYHPKTGNRVDPVGANRDMNRLQENAIRFQQNMAFAMETRRALASPEPQNMNIQVECRVDASVILEELKKFHLALLEEQKSMRSCAGAGIHIEEADRGAETSVLLKEHRMSVLFRSEADVVGLDDRKAELLDWLRSGERKRLVIPIVGAAGGGKTTLARQVYNSVGQEEFPCRVWLALSPGYMHSNDGLQPLFRRIADGIGGGHSENLQDMDGEGLRKHVNGILKDMRYLMVLDDVWESNVWGIMKSYLPDSGNGSRVIITSRHGKVVPIGSIFFKVDPLGDEHSRELLLKEASVEDAAGLDEEVREFAKRAAGSCQGSPLELVQLGALLGKQERNVTAWEHAYEAYRRGEEEEGMLCLESMRLSYTHLPPYLETPYLYLGLFPNGYSIGTEKLIHLYVAEVFAGSKDHAEKTAEKYLKELEQWNIVEINERQIPRAAVPAHGVHRYPSFEDRASFCRVLGRLQDIAREKAREKGFAHFLKGRDRPGACTWIALHDHSASIDDTLQQGDGESYTSQQMILDLRKTTAPVPFALFKLLRVLEMEGIQVRTLPEEIGDLGELLHLGLKDSGVAVLPESISRLSRLMTLDARNSRLLDLPKGVWKIKSLRHVLCRCEPAVLDGGSELRTLDGARTGQWVEFDFASTLPKLLLLKLFGTRRSRAPMIGPALLPQSLVEVRLFDMVVIEDLWSALQALPSLQILHLVCCLVSFLMVSATGGFPKVGVLVFMDLVGAGRWEVEENAMRSLARLSLIRCADLVMEPSDVLNLCAREIHCVGMSEEFMANLEDTNSFRTEYGWRGSHEIPLLHNHKDLSDRKPATVVCDMVSMISPVLPAPRTHGQARVDAAIKAMKELHQMQDLMNVILANVSDSKHSLEWSSKRDPWAKIWVGEAETICSIFRKCLSLLQKLTFPLVDVVQTSSQLRSCVPEVYAIAEDLSRLKRKMGL